jgi:hypothetical protein
LLRREDEAVSERKPPRCRIGWHAWFLDCAMLTCAECCDWCGTYRSEHEAKELRRERALWAKYDDPGKVAIGLATGENPAT